MITEAEREMRNIRLSDNFETIDAKVLDAWFEMTINKYPNSPLAKHIGQTFRLMAEKNNPNFIGKML